MPGIAVTGVDMHIGSQITDLAPFDAAFERAADLVRALREDGHAIDHLDLGGGLGIPYRAGEDPDSYHPDRYATVVTRHAGNLGLTVVLEPGRLIVGNAGILVTRVIYVKRGEGRTFVIVDAAMNDLIRPTLYEAHHEIVPVRRAAGRHARDRRRRRRAGLRDRRLSRPRPRHAGAGRPAICSPSCRPALTARCRPAPTIRARSSRKCWSPATAASSCGRGKPSPT